jgi:hypothetical protein
VLALVTAPVRPPLPGKLNAWPGRSACSRVRAAAPRISPLVIRRLCGPCWGYFKRRRGVFKQSVGKPIFLFLYPPAPRKIDFHKIHRPILQRSAVLTKI